MRKKRKTSGKKKKEIKRNDGKTYNKRQQKAEVRAKQQFIFFFLLE